MTYKFDPVGEAGLRFFGCMSASISHEIKNVLAIIKENAGLLSDYNQMVDNGMDVKPEKYQAVAARIEKQTQRADGIIKILNQFAHTVDNSCQPVDLNGTLALLAALSHRSASYREIAISIEPVEPGAHITTSHFLLLNLLGLFLDYALKAVQPGQSMKITAKKSQGIYCIHFGRLTSLTNLLSSGGFPNEHETALLEALQAEWEAKPESDEILIWLPINKNE